MTICQWTRIVAALAAAAAVAVFPLEGCDGIAPGAATVATAPVSASTPTLTSVSPSLIAVMTSASPPVPLTIDGAGFSPTSEIVVSGVLLPATFVSSTRLTCFLPWTVPQAQFAGGLVVNVQEGIADVSNMLVVRVGGGSNQGSIRRHPLIPAPGDFFRGMFEGGAPLAPLSIILDLTLVPPAFPWPNAAQDLVLSVSPEIGSPGPFFALVDGLGLLGVPDGSAFDAAGRFSTPLFQLPDPPFGLAMVAQGIYPDASAPAGFRLTWARYPDLL